MKIIFSILLLFCWTFTSLSAKIHSPLVFDQTAHIQSILKQNSESELPEHYQSFSEIDLKDEKNRFLLFTISSLLPELNDSFSFSKLIYYSLHFYSLHVTVVFILHLPLYMVVRHLLI